MKDELILEQGADDGNWFTTPDGQRHREAGGKLGGAVVEREGPLHATIRVDGHYEDPKGRPSCRWTARLHFHAGRPAIHVVHTFTWIGRADQLQIRDLALSFGLAKAATEAAADRSDETLGESVARPLKAGELLALLQDQHWHLGHGDSHFGILAGPADKPQEIAEGKRAGCWVGASDGRHGVTLALRELWQQFPKELRVEPKRLTAYLWSAAGNAGTFDLSTDGLERFWGKPMVEQLNAAADGLYQRWRAAPQANDPTGMAKTHELLLLFHRGGAADGGRLAETFDTPPLVLSDPHWTRQSEVVGRLWPKDDQRFPEMERWIEAVWRDAFEVLDDWGDYGFFSYGDGPHASYTLRSGRAVASPWRYTQASEYGVHLAAWLGWLRSGDRRLHDFAVAKTRYLNDLCMCHEDSPSRWQGSFSGGVAPVPWATMPGGQKPPLSRRVLLFEFFIQHALYHYYLSGDQRSLDVVTEFADGLRAMLESDRDWARNFVATINSSSARWYYQRIEDLAVFYEHFGDDWFHKKAIELANLVLDPDDSSGIARENAKYPTYIFYKGAHLLTYLRNLEGKDLERARQSFVHMAEHQLRTQSLETRTAGMRMAYAYYFTKDPRYLTFGSKRVDDERRANNRSPQGERRYTTPLTRYWLYPVLTNGPYLMAALAEGPDLPPVPLLYKHFGSAPVEFGFVQEAGKPLKIELSATGATLFGPDGKEMPDAWLGRAIAYYPHSDGIAALNVDQPLHYRTVTVPAEAPAGEVRVRVPRDGAAYVFSTSAARAVMLAPDGFSLGGGFLITPAREVRVGGGHDDRWHFLVPPGAKRFRFSSGSPSLAQRLVIRDPSGQVVQSRRAGIAGWVEVTVPEGAAGKLWSISATAVADVTLVDVQPVFAYRNPDAHFLPANVAVRKGPAEEPLPKGPDKECLGEGGSLP